MGNEKIVIKRIYPLKVKEPTLCYLESVIMPNGEIIHQGKKVTSSLNSKVYKAVTLVDELDFLIK